MGSVLNKRYQLGKKLVILNIHLFLAKGGHSFRSSIETQKIRAGPGNSLDISSSVGQVHIRKSLLLRLNKCYFEKKLCQHQVILIRNQNRICRGLIT